MEINRFFGQPFGFKVPRRVYARSIDYEPRAYEIFDAVDADAVDSEPQTTFSPAAYGRFIQKAPIYSVEIHAEPMEGTEKADFEEPWAIAADLWLDNHEMRGPWVELTLDPASDGPAEVFGSTQQVEGQRAQITSRNVSPRLGDTLDRITSLDRFNTSADDIEGALPASVIAGIVVLDVGQGSAAAIVSDQGRVVAYVDMGAGITKDTNTWPKAGNGFCLEHDPPIILSHWHLDHFDGANRFQHHRPSPHSMTWIAPNQPLGAAAQIAMANAIAAQGQLLVWGSGGALQRGQLVLEQCGGPAKDQNRSGIAVWVEPPADDMQKPSPILLPGDAGYGDIPGLAANPPRGVHSFAVAHHGGRASGRPPPRPTGARMPRAAMSCGQPNQYNHPLKRWKAGLRAAGWKIGHPGRVVDDPRTGHRSAHPTNGLGNIGLDWERRSLTVVCTCGATVAPVQY